MPVCCHVLALLEQPLFHEFAAHGSRSIRSTGGKENSAGPLCAVSVSLPPVQEENWCVVARVGPAFPENCRSMSSSPTKTHRGGDPTRARIPVAPSAPLVAAAAPSASAPLPSTCACVVFLSRARSTSNPIEAPSPKSKPSAISEGKYAVQQEVRGSLVCFRGFDALRFREHQRGHSRAMAFHRQEEHTQCICATHGHRFVLFSGGMPCLSQGERRHAPACNHVCCCPYLAPNKCASTKNQNPPQGTVFGSHTLPHVRTPIASFAGLSSFGLVQRPDSRRIVVAPRPSLAPAEAEVSVCLMIHVISKYYLGPLRHRPRARTGPFFLFFCET